MFRSRYYHAASSLSVVAEEGTAIASEEETPSSGKRNQGGGKRKMRLQDIPEEAGITAEFAEKLDLSCVAVGKGTIQPPAIDNGHVVKFNRCVLLSNRIMLLQNNNLPFQAQEGQPCLLGGRLPVPRKPRTGKSGRGSNVLQQSEVGGRETALLQFKWRRRGGGGG